MPNGPTEQKSTRSSGRRLTDYNPDWCNERHDQIDKKLAEIWGREHGGIQAIWETIRSMNRLLWAILLGQVAILGGITVAILQAFFKSGGCG